MTHWDAGVWRRSLVVADAGDGSQGKVSLLRRDGTGSIPDRRWRVVSAVRGLPQLESGWFEPALRDLRARQGRFAHPAHRRHDAGSSKFAAALVAQDATLVGGAGGMSHAPGRPIRNRDATHSPLLPETIPPLLRRIYAARGVTRPDQLHTGLESLLPVGSLEGVDQAAALLREHRDGRVLVVGDFDADGATSTALMLRALNNWGFARPISWCRTDSSSATD